EGVAEAPLQHDVPVAGIAPLGGAFAGGDVGAVVDGVAERPQPSEGCFLHDGLGKRTHAASVCFLSVQSCTRRTHRRSSSRTSYTQNLCTSQPSSMSLGLRSWSRKHSSPVQLR